MADLLECLIQIKGVADTPRRLALRVADVTGQSSSGSEADHLARSIASRMAAAELLFRDCLSRMLMADRPALPALAGVAAPPDTRLSAAEYQASFAARRTETVRVLERCSAEQLNRKGVEPGRGPMTVADLVAVMLAHDTDSLGDLVIR